MRKPTDEDYKQYKGAHCFNLWKSLDDTWRCPACGRTKFEIMRWTRRSPGKCTPFHGWMAGLHLHHDHSKEYGDNHNCRFSMAVICDQCNSADAAAKRHLNLPVDFSFSPAELKCFVQAVPHSRHKIDYDKAYSIFLLVKQTS